MTEYISKEAAVDAGYLSDWYIASVGDEPPVWTDAHIDELLNDFIVIPKYTKSADVQSVDTKEILRHLDSLMICVCNAYNTSHGLLESDMEFIKKQEKNIKELCGADKISIKNELDYCPFDYNMHTLRITLNYCGAVGHISFLRGGNCKGANILDTALSFFADCDKAELERLVEDDCKLEMFELDNEILFNVTLHKGDDEYEFEAISEDELQDMIVAIEIADCMGQIEVEDI